MKAKMRNLAAVSFISIMMLASISTVSNADTGYSPSSWAAEKISICEKAGIIPDDFKDSPYNQNISRLEFFELIANTCKIYGIQLPELNGSHPFGDTQDIAAEYAYMLGLSHGTAPGVFSPDEPLTREMAAVVVSRIRQLFEGTADRSFKVTDRGGYMDERGKVYKTEDGTLAYAQPMDKQQAEWLLDEYSSDSLQISEWAKANIADVYSLGLISGVGGGKLDPKGNITCEQAAMMSLNVLAYNNESKLKEAGVEECVIPAPAAIYISPSYTKSYAYLSWNAVPSASAYDITIYQNETPAYFTRITDNYIDLGKGSPETLIESIFGGENKSFRSAIKVVPVNSEGRQSLFSMKKEFTIKAWENLNELITGDPYKSQFGSIDEADRNMAEITIRVWDLDSSGAKVTVTRTLNVNKSVAEDVKNIFEEIYNGKEKFPVKSISGYSYRDGKSQHSNGTAIDINPNENYFLLSSGRISAGSFWKPGVNPYSINPNGDVVRAFNKYGWHWSPDMNWPNGKDYMHFSLLGK